MTKQELNRDVKRLAKVAQEYAGTGFNEEKHNSIVAELRRLYYADDTFEYFTHNSVLTMLRLNISYRAIPLHVFGSKIKY